MKVSRIVFEGSPEEFETVRNLFTESVKADEVEVDAQQNTERTAELIEQGLTNQPTTELQRAFFQILWDAGTNGIRRGDKDDPTSVLGKLKNMGFEMASTGLAGITGSIGKRLDRVRLKYDVAIYRIYVDGEPHYRMTPLLKQVLTANPGLRTV